MDHQRRNISNDLESYLSTTSSHKPLGLTQNHIISALTACHTDLLMFVHVALTCWSVCMWFSLKNFQSCRNEISLFCTVHKNPIKHPLFLPRCVVHSYKTNSQTVLTLN